MTRTLVTGAGGFIGHHLVSYLKRRGEWVRGVDLVRSQYAPTDADEFLELDCVDCVDGLVRLMNSGYREPLNLGQDRLISINQLADLVCGIAGVALVKRHVDGPQGVRGRNSDNTRLREVLGWEPCVPLEEGLARTYAWIEGEVRRQFASGTAATLAAQLSSAGNAS